MFVPNVKLFVSSLTYCFYEHSILVVDPKRFPGGREECSSVAIETDHPHSSQHEEPWRKSARIIYRLGVLLPVNRLTRHAEPFVRQQCCALIRVLAGQPFGKETAVRDAALVRNLLALMADTVYGVRLYGTAAVLALAEHRLGNETMVELSCADRALYRAYVEPDDRVTLTALRVVGRLMATNRTARDRTNGTAASLGRFFGGIGHGDCDDGGSTIGRPGRALIDRLIRDVRSPDYRTALDAVTGLARAVVVPEVNGYVARDRDTVDLLTSFVLSPVLRKRALRPLSVRLLCSLANTAAGLGNLRASMPPATADNLASCRSDDNDDDDPKTKRYLRKLAAATASGSIQK